MIKELFRAFLLVFAAEMGDKTQIIAMTFATQYKVKEVRFRCHIWSCIKSWNCYYIRSFYF